MCPVFLQFEEPLTYATRRKPLKRIIIYIYYAYYSVMIVIIVLILVVFCIQLDYYF